MTKSKLIIFSALVIAIAIIFAVIINNAFNTQRSYTIFTLDEYGVCFMMSSEMNYKITEHGFKYSGKKNYGEFTLNKNGLMQEANQVEINDFKAAYKKQKNLRIYQYLLNEEGVVLTDNFVYVKKIPLNIVPYRKECKSIKENYPKHLKLNISII